MGRTAALRNSVANWLFPLLEAKGFQRTGTSNPLFVEFKKITDQEIWIVAVQWEMYGKPRFVVNFDKFPQAGIRWNETNYPAEAIDDSFAHCRLQPRHGPSTSNWFRQDRSLVASVLCGSRFRPEEEVVDELMSMIEEIFDWFENDNAGSHVCTDNRLKWALQSNA